VSRETTISWPETRLGCALRSDYRGRVDEQFKRTEVSDGPARFRRMRNTERRVYGLTFLWTLEQLDFWESWHDSVLAAGLRWFMLPSLTGRGMTPMFAHMLGGWEVTPDPMLLDRYRVAFEVETHHGPASVPPPLISGGPIDGFAPWQLPTDAIDGRALTDPRPSDVVNSLTPGAVP
jgi:hypothetical protein